MEIKELLGRLKKVNAHKDKVKNIKDGGVFTDEFESIVLEYEELKTVLKDIKCVQKEFDEWINVKLELAFNKIGKKCEALVGSKIVASKSSRTTKIMTGDPEKIYSNPKTKDFIELKANTKTLNEYIKLEEEKQRELKKAGEEYEVKLPDGFAFNVSTSYNTKINEAD